ncbi:hypothetical protein TNCV_3661631 [Trichonephila clavipes]|nr:hypothetical protein TNCV_3661631 [Trichonephila clavipes]
MKLRISSEATVRLIREKLGINLRGSPAGPSQQTSLPPERKLATGEPTHVSLLTFSLHPAPKYLLMRPFDVRF